MIPDVIMMGGDGPYDDAISSCYYLVDQMMWDLPSNWTDGDTIRLIPFLFANGNHEVGFESFKSHYIYEDNSTPIFKLWFP